MNSQSLVRTIVCSVVQMMSIITYAESDHGHQKAHIHGISEIKLAIGLQGIEIHFESPANNLVGFEHSAISAKEIQRVKQASKVLSNPASIFLFDGTRCEATFSSIDISDLLNPHDKHGHQDTHNEVSAHYHFQCPSISELNHIEIQLFDQFPAISEIHLQWISETHQGMSTLTPDNTQLVINK